MTVADRMAVMQAGRIAQVGTPDEIYEHPASRYVAGFIGDINLVAGRVAQTGPHAMHVVCEGIGVVVTAAMPQIKPGAELWLALRPEKIAVARERSAGSAENVVGGTVTQVGYRGEQSVLEVRTAHGAELKVSVPNRQRRAGETPSAGEQVWLAFPPDNVVVLTQ